MNDEFNKDKVLGRIRKMLALANDAAASEGERDNAMRMVHATLAKYNLSMAEAEAGGQQSEEARGREDDFTHGAPWARQVCHALADLFFCRYYFVKVGPRVKHHFVGRQSSAITAREMAMYVFKSIERQARAENPPEFKGSSVWISSFCKGAAMQVQIRCAELRKAAEAPAPSGTPGTALVLADYYENERRANEAFLRSLGVKLRSAPNRQRSTDVDGAWGAGNEYGKRVSLNNQVGASKPSNAPRLKG